MAIIPMNRFTVTLITTVIVLLTIVFHYNFNHSGNGIGSSPEVSNSDNIPSLIQETKFNQEDGSSEKVSVDLEEIMAGPLAQDDVRITNYISNNKVLVPPSSNPYNLKRPNVDPSQGQSTVVKKIFQNMRDGFFIECGGLDGETRSNTLSLEKDFGWKGLLIEGDPSNFKLLLGKERKAWAANVCLATKPYPHRVLFQQHFNVGKIFGDATNSSGKRNGKGLVEVQCYPLFSLLAALSIRTVDYFSLDVEGNEYQVLENIPFDKVLIKVLSVEYIHGAEGKGESGIAELMKSKGYRVVTKVTNSGWLANDLIFAHESVVINETIDPIHT